jgi:hypothetical protein
MVLFAIALASGCSPFAEKTAIEDKGTSDGRPYSSPESKVTVTVPAGWTIKEVHNKASSQLRFDALQNGGAAAFQIERFKESSNQPDGAVNWLVFKTLKDGTSPNAKLEFLNEGPSKLKGLSVYAADLKNSAMTGRIICFYKNRHQYAVTYFVARTPQSNEMNAAIKASLNTLEFL